MYYTLLGLFILSRLFFITTGDVFFDSGENIDLFTYPNYFQALISGHFPPHIGYILIFWPVFQLMNIVSFNPLFWVILGQVILSTFTVISFFKVVEFLSDKRTALIASTIISLITLFWITNVTIMMEIAYVAFFFFAFYFLIKYLNEPKKLLYLHLYALSFTLSFLTHMLIVLWLPLLLAVVFYKNKTLFLKTFLTTSAYLIVFSIVNVFFIAVVSDRSIPAVFHHLYLTKGNELAYLPMNLYGLLVSIRNFLLPLLRNNTSLIVILGFISLLFLFRKNKKFFILGVLWIGPALYTNQWWDSLLNGRHGIIASFGFAFLIGYMLRKKLIFAYLVFIYLMFASVPVLLQSHSFYSALMLWGFDLYLLHKTNFEKIKKKKF